MAYQSDFHNRRTPPPSQQRRDFLRSQLDKRIAESKAQGYGTATFPDMNNELSKLNKQINANIHASEASNKRQPSMSAIKKAAAAGQTLFASQPSTCFTEVSWTDGTCTVSFAHKTIGDWSFPLSLDDFLDFANAPEGLGSYWNSELYGS